MEIMIYRKLCQLYNVLYALVYAEKPDKEMRIIIYGKLCRIYIMFYKLVYIEEPDKDQSLLKHVGEAMFFWAPLITGIICFYAFSLVALNEGKNTKERIENIIDLQNELGKMSFYCWLTINAILIGYIFISYTTIASATVVIVSAIMLLSKIEVKLNCDASY